MKAIWAIIGAIILVIIICFFFVYYKFDYILSRILSSEFNAKVRIEHVHLKRPHIDIKDFTIQNPNGFSIPLALRINDVDINAPFGNYFKKVIHIERFDLKDIEINIEFTGRRGSESNWSHLIGHLSKEPNKHKKPGIQENQDGPGRYAIIKLLTIQNLRVNIITPGQKTQTKVFRNMQFNDVITKKGEITKRISQVILYHMIFNYKSLIKIPTQFENQGVDGALNIFEQMGPFKFPDTR